MDNLILSAEKLFEIAQSAYQRSRYQKPNFADGGQNDAIIAITFSVMTVEAFLNELIELAKDRDDLEAQSLFSVIEPLLQARESIEIRLLQASCSTSDTPFDNGRLPFQSFNLLVRVRNRLVHLLAGDKITDGLIEEHQTILSSLKSHRVIIADHKIPINRDDEGLMEKYGAILSDQEINSISLPFIYAVATQSVAKWSCQVASTVITTFINNMRDSPFKSLLQQYSQSFQIIPDNLQELLEWHKIITSFGCSNADEFISKIRNKQLIVSLPKTIKNAE
ncbi:hypothetical protein [Pseudanabaena minima]|uniref:hypothetical protein n=1 Tax=Pseudanabaena minima TaxID=890415 RepID=UPI003DA9723C